MNNSNSNNQSNDDHVCSDIDIFQEEEFKALGEDLTQGKKNKMNKAVKQLMHYEPLFWKWLARRKCETRRPNGPRVITWGKYKGTEIRKLPSDYVEWIVNKSDCPDGVKQYIYDQYNGNQSPKSDKQ